MDNDEFVTFMFETQFEALQFLAYCDIGRCEEVHSSLCEVVDEHLVVTCLARVTSSPLPTAPLLPWTPGHEPPGSWQSPTSLPELSATSTTPSQRS